MECTNINLKKGSKGDQVKQAQEILKKLGYYNGILDGDYGDLTIEAVRKYQRSKGTLATDGIIGPITCKHLQKEETTDPTHIHTIQEITGHKFMKAEIERIARIYRTHLKNNKNYPNYLTITDANNQTYNIGRTAYMGIFEDCSRFAVKNGRMPNYVVASSSANNPLAIDYQNNGYNCGPTSLSMCFQMLALWVSEPTLARVCGTTRYGTGPNELIKGAKEYDINMYVIDRNINSVRKALNEGSPVLMHIHTSYAGGKSCLGYSGAYGHYIMCYGTSGDYYLIADPTKGFRKCKASSIDNARSSTNMKYYRLDPQ